MAGAICLRQIVRPGSRPPITVGKRTVNLDVKLVSLSPGMHVTATTKTGERFGSAKSFLLTQIFYSGVI